jgi:hypothetical protein
VSLPDMHASDDLLAAAAMGDALPETAQQHVSECATCTERVSEYVRLLDLGRSSSAADIPREPAPALWAGISSELGLSSADEQVNAGAEVIPLQRRARWSTSWLVAAAAAGIVAGVALTTVGGSVLDGGSAPVAAPTPVVMAQTALAPLPEKQGTGRAEIVDTEDGQELVVDVSGLSTGEGFYEVWLIDPKTFEMVGLGALTHDEGRFPIPDGLDLDQYRVVDVSIEPYDGDPVHSRDSVVRGELHA